MPLRSLIPVAPLLLLAACAAPSPPPMQVAQMHPAASDARPAIMESVPRSRAVRRVVPADTPPIVRR